MFANLILTDCRCLIASVALACLPALGVVQLQPSIGRTFEELSAYDPAEVAGHRVLRTAQDRLYKDPAQAKAALTWSCELSAKSLEIGEHLTAVVTVRNPSDVAAFRLSPPARGFLVGNLQVWVRDIGETKYRPIDGWNSYPGKTPQRGVPVRIGPGETRRWTSRLDHFAGILTASGAPGELPIGRVYWLGGTVLDKPGKFEVVLRYVNTEPDLPWQMGPFDLHQSVGVADRLEPSGARVFGPFALTVTRPPDVEWIQTALKLWNAERPTGSDAIVGLPKSSVSPFDDLTVGNLRAAGSIGDDVRLWLLARDWKRIRQSNDEYVRYLGAVETVVERLPAGHPNRAAGEFLCAAARLDRRDASWALSEGLTSTNPDVQLLVGRWLAERLRQPERK